MTRRAPCLLAALLGATVAACAASAHEVEHDAAVVLRAKADLLDDLAGVSADAGDGEAR